MNLKFLLLAIVVLVSLLISAFIGRTLYHHYYHKTHTVLASNFSFDTAHDVIPVAIIGSGPAGLSAALFTTRELYHTVVFQGPKPGGLLADTATVENWPGILQQAGKEIMTTLDTQVRKFGGIIVDQTIERVDFTRWPYALYTNDGKELWALSVIIATGVWPRKLEIPGENIYWGKGVAGCTICDAPLTKGKEVVVVGGGDSGLNQALHIAPFAKNITILVHEDTLSASSHFSRKLKEHTNISILYHHKPVQITGDNNNITQILVQDTHSGDTKPLIASWIFVAIGYQPNTGIFKSFIRTDAKGIIQLNPYTQATSLPGIFAAGRVASPHYKLGATASGDGIKAGLDAMQFLEKHGYDAEKLAAHKDHFYIHATPELATAIDTGNVSSVLTQSALDAILNTSQPVLLEFFSPQCPHCQAMESIVHELSSELQGQVMIAQSDITQDNQLIDQFNIKGVPAFIFFVNKQEKRRQTGQMSKQELRSFIQND